MLNLLLVVLKKLSRDKLPRHLKRKGYDLRIVVDGKQGLEIGTSESPNLIVTDLSLPQYKWLESYKP